MGKGSESTLSMMPGPWSDTDALQQEVTAGMVGAAGGMAEASVAVMAVMAVASVGPVATVVLVALASVLVDPDRGALAHGAPGGRLLPGSGCKYSFTFQAEHLCPHRVLFPLFFFTASRAVGHACSVA